MSGIKLGAESLKGELLLSKLLPAARSGYTDERSLIFFRSVFVIFIIAFLTVLLRVQRTWKRAN